MAPSSAEHSKSLGLLRTSKFSMLVKVGVSPGVSAPGVELEVLVPVAEAVKAGDLVFVAEVLDVEVGEGTAVLVFSESSSSSLDAKVAVGGGAVGVAVGSKGVFVGVGLREDPWEPSSPPSFHPRCGPPEGSSAGALENPGPGSAKRREAGPKEVKIRVTINK